MMRLIFFRFSKNILVISFKRKTSKQYFRLRQSNPIYYSIKVLNFPFKSTILFTIQFNPKSGEENAKPLKSIPLSSNFTNQMLLIQNYLKKKYYNTFLQKDDLKIDFPQNLNQYNYKVRSMLPQIFKRIFVAFNDIFYYCSKLLQILP